MFAKFLIAAVMVAATLDGHAQTPPPGASFKRCVESQPGCPVTVTVPAACNACVPKVEFDYVAVEKGKKLRITWRLATPNYKFDARKGIVFPDDPNGDEFKCRAEQNATVYVCDNKHSTGGKTYKYVVNVTGPGGPKPLDPWIINE